MKRSTPWLLILSAILFATAAIAFICSWMPAAFAQHVGGGHVGGGGHVSAPHASAPVTVAPHVMISRPIVASGGPPPDGAGTRNFAVTPPVRLIPPRGITRPILGNHAMLPQTGAPGAISPGAQMNMPHTIIGFPRTDGARGPVGTNGSPALHFSGQGHEIWQDSATFPRRPRLPVRPFFPIVSSPGFGFFGSPFFGLGLGFGFNSIWWPSCGPFWGWGYGCNALPYYDYGLGYYGSYGPGNLENQVESEPGPQVYGNPSATSPIYVFGEEARELVQLYLKDGTLYNVTDYWLVNDQLHFTALEEGGTKSVEHAIDFDQLDLQKTIDLNTQRGFRFVLRNEPLEQYLQDHPDNSADPPPQMGPAGPLQPTGSQPQDQASPQQLH